MVDDRTHADVIVMRGDRHELSAERRVAARQHGDDVKRRDALVAGRLGLTRHAVAEPAAAVRARLAGHEAEAARLTAVTTNKRAKGKAADGRAKVAETARAEAERQLGATRNRLQKVRDTHMKADFTVAALRDNLTGDWAQTWQSLAVDVLTGFVAERKGRKRVVWYWWATKGLNTASADAEAAARRRADEIAAKVPAIAQAKAEGRIIVIKYSGPKGEWWRVRVGPFSSCETLTEGVAGKCPGRLGVLRSSRRRFRIVSGPREYEFFQKLGPIRRSPKSIPRARMIHGALYMCATIPARSRRQRWPRFRTGSPRPAAARVRESPRREDPSEVDEEKAWTTSSS